MFKSLKNLLQMKIKVYLTIVQNKNIVLGQGVRIDWNTNINLGRNKLIIGNDVYLRSNPNGYHAGMPFPTTILVDKENAQCIIGDNCRINGCYIHAQKKVTIGKNTVIASGSNIIDSNGHISLSRNRTVGRDDAKEIYIGENVWIGLNSLILKGSIIGDNSIVAAGSVVKGSFPKNSLIQGNPAVLVKELKIN